MAAQLGSPESAVTMDAAADLALAYLSQGKFAESEPLAREAVEFDRKKRAGRLAAIPRREPARRQLGWGEEIRRGGTAAARRLSRNGGTERPHGSPGPVSSEPRTRMDCATLSGLGQAERSGRLEEEIVASNNHFL